MQLLNPNGTPMMQVGEQFDTSYSPGMVFFSASGEPLTILDDAGLTVNNSSGNPLTVVNDSGITLNNSSGSPIVELNDSGMTVLDGSTTRVSIGSFSNGDYGLQVTNTAGTSQMVNPVASAYSSGGGSTTSTTFAPIGFGKLTAPIGASGKALAFVSGVLSVEGSGQSVEIGISINGASPSTFVLYLQANTAAVNATCGASVVLSGLNTQADNTFDLWGLTSNSSDTATFESLSLIIWPL
jgi:hypothetical protein